MLIQLDDDDLHRVTGGLGALRQAFAQNHPIATGVLRRLGFGRAAPQPAASCPNGDCGGGGGAQ